MLIASVDDLGLVNDTGSSDTDLITTDPQVAGVVNGDFTSGHVEVEFDHHADGTTEGNVSVQVAGGSFNYDPRDNEQSLASYSGSFTLDYRAVEYDDTNNVVYTSDWQAFTYTIANPDISVTEEVGGYTYVVDDGIGWVSYGNTIPGTSVDKTFTVTNDGLETLTLDAGSLTVPDGFSVQTPFASSVAPSESTTLVIQLDAMVEGSFGGDVSFANNDNDENPFNFHIEGNVVPPAPEVSVTAVDEWGDPYELASGSDWVYYDDTTEGSPLSETFTINNTGTSDLTLDIASLSVPDGFSVTTPFVATVAPNESTTFTIQLDAAQAGYYSGTVSFVTNDSDENPFQFYVGGDVTSGGGASAEIVVYDASSEEVTDDTGSVDAGQTTVGTPITYTFTIENQGDVDLTLDTASLSLPAGFSLVTGFDETVAAGGGETSLAIQLDAGSVDSYSGELSFATNDPDENPYNFTVSGDVTSAGPSAEIVVLDQSDQNVADGTGSVDVGETPVGTAIAYTFTIQNQGDADLALDSASLSLPAGFSLVTAFDQTVAANGGQTSLTVQLDATSSGAHSGELSFSTNDPNENPFNFTISGDVTGSTNSPPVVVAAIADVTVDEDSASTTIDLAPVFDDPDLGQGDSLTLSIGANNNQTLVSTAISGQQLTLTYAANGNGSATITVVATDSQSATAQDEFTVTVNPVNDAPVASGDAYQVLHDAPYTRNAASGVLANDTDVDGDVLTAIVVSEPQNGTLSLEADGSFTYTPNPGFLGQDLFAYKITDGVVETASVPVEITVYNTAPVASADEFVTGRNRTLSVETPGILSNDVDLDQETLEITQVSDVVNGTLTLEGDGGFVYTPNADFIGTDSFTYFVGDGIADSDTVAVEIEIRNDPPRAAGDSFTVLPGEGLTVSGEELLRNDYDFDGDDLTPSLVKDVSHGTLVFEADGAFTYTPNAGFVGFDTFHYQLYDGIDFSQPAVVFIHVDNDKPRAHDRSHRIVHDTTLTVDADSGLLAWASDPDDQSLSVVVVSGVSHGTLTVEADGAYTYVPDMSFAGIDSFSYRVTDGFLQSDTATVRIEVANTAPATTNDMFPVIAGEILTVEAPGVLQNDVDVDGEVLSATLASDVAHGWLALESDGSFTYEPDAGYSGLDSFTYAVSDGISQTHATAYVQVIGSGSDDSLYAEIDHYQVSHGQTLSIGHSRGVLANDRHPHGDWLDAVLVDNTTQGSLTLYDDGSFVYTPTNAAFVGTDTFTYKAGDGTQETAVVAVTIDIVNSNPTVASAAFQVHHGQTLYPPGLGLIEFVSDADWDDLTYTVVSGVSSGTLEMGTDGTFTYTPNEGFVGSDSFTYKVNDGVTDSNIGTVTIDVTNKLPSGVDMTYHMQHDTTFDSGGVGVLSGATDADGDVLKAAVATQPGHGTLVLAEDGTFTYTPNENYAGTDSFTFTVSDGAQNSSPSTVTIYVLNETPVAVGATHSVHHSDTLTRWLETWDPDGDDVTYTVTDQVDHGTLTVGTDGQFTYTPNAGYVGDDAFTYTTSDGIASSEPSTVTIHVTNTKPTGIELSYSIHAGESISFAAPGLLDYAWDANGDDLAVVGQSVTLSHGSLTLGSNGQWSYASNGNSKGTETFTYQVHDGAEASDPATVTIHVTNEAPRAYDQHFFFHHTEGQVSGSEKTLSFNLMASGYVLDPDEDPITVSLHSSTSGVTVNADGTGTITVPVDFVGEVTFEYVANDGIDDSEPATVTIVVGNSVPRAHDDYFTVRSGDMLEFQLTDLLKNDFDMDGDTLTLVGMSSPTAGSLVYDVVSGFYEYTPGGFTGTATFTYTIEDGVASATATVHIDVVNTAPWTMGNSYQVYTNETLSPGSLAERGAVWDLETSADQITVIPQGGGVSMDSSGAFTYSPAETPEVAAARLVARGFTIYDDYEWKEPMFIVNDGLLDNEIHGDGDGDNDNLASIYLENVPNPGFGFSDDVLPQFKLIEVDPETPAASIEDSQIQSQAPPAVVPDTFWGQHDQDITGNLLSNDFAFKGTLQFHSLGGGSGNAAPQHGQITVGPDGSFVYTPDAGFVGEDSFWYTVTDGTHTDSSQVSMIVVNNAPVAMDDGVIAVLHGQPAVGNLLENDFDIDDEPLSIVIHGAGDPVTVDPAGPETIVDMPDGTLHVAPDGQFTYYPDDHSTGRSDFSYTISDGAEADGGEVKLAYYNHAPLAHDQLFHFDAGAATHDVTIATSDPDGEALTYTIGSPSSGTFEPDPGPGAPDNAFIFTPPSSEWSGVVQFPVTVTDSAGASLTVQMTVEVVAPEGSPTVQEVPITTQNDDFLWSGCGGSGIGNVLNNDTAHQSPPLQVVGVSPAAGAFGTLTIDADGTAHYQADTDMADAFVQAGPDTFIYTVTDSAGMTKTGEVSVSVAMLQAGQSLSCGTSSVSNVGPGAVYAWLDGTAFVRPAGSGEFWIGTGNADLDWAGDAESLTLSVDGDVVSQVDITGDLDVSAYHLPKHVVGGTVVVSLLGRAESVTATDRIELVYAAEGVGDVRAGGDIDLVIAPYAGHVDSVVSSGGTVSAVYSNEGNVGKVEAHKSIGFVWAGGGDILGTVRAETEDIGFVKLQDDWVDIMLPEYNALVQDTKCRGLFAMQDILGHVSAGRDATVVWASRNIAGSVTAGRDLLMVRAEDGAIFETAVIRAERDLGTVDAELTLSGPSSAGRYLGMVHAGQSITATADVTATVHVGGVLASIHLNADVKTEQGSITNVTAGYAGVEGDIANSTIYAGKNIGTANALMGDITNSNIRADGGYLGDVTAKEIVDTDIEALASVGTITAETLFRGSLLSQRSYIEAVNVTEGDLDAPVTAALHVGPVFARDDILREIRGGAVTQVTAQTGKIDKAITGTKHIGNITAGTDIVGAITSGATGTGIGNIGKVIAGDDTVGDIFGAITAGKNVHLVHADGNVDDTGYVVFAADAQTLYQTALSAWMDDPNAVPTTVPKPPRAEAPPVGAVGTIHESVSAGEHVGAVSADKDILHGVTAAGRLYLVGARGNVQDGASAGQGSMTVMAGREMHGDIDAPGHIFASSYDQMDSKTTSTLGAVVVNSWSTVTREITGPAGVHVGAYDSITSFAITSANGPVAIGSYSDVTSTISASQAIAAGLLGKFTGSVISHESDAFASAVAGIEGQINAQRQAVAASLATINAAVTAEGVAVATMESSTGPLTADQSVRMDVLNEVSGGVTSNNGHVYIEASTVKDSVTAPNGYVGLDVFGNLDAQVEGGKGVTVSVLGTVNNASGNSIASTDGGVLILADGDVGGSVTAGDDKVGIGMVSWGSVSADLTAEHGPVVVTFSHGNVSGPIQAGKQAKVTTWGSVLASVDAGDDAVIVARHDVDDIVAAGRDARISAGGNVYGIVTADRDALVYANADIIGMITGARDATADALGAVDADVEATSRDALVSALGDYDGDVEAGRQATVTVGGSIANVAVNAGDTAQLSAHGLISQTQVAADKDAFILGDTNVDTSQFQSSGGSVVLAVLDAIDDVDVQAAVDAQVFAGLDGDLDATAISRDLDVVVLGDLKGTFSAGTDALVAAYGAINGGENAVTVTATGGAASVFGKEGVAATVSGLSVTASSLSSVSGTYTATGDETAVYTGGNFSGTASANHSVAVTAAESISGTVTSQYRNAAAYSWGQSGSAGASVSAEVSGMNEAWVTALSGSVTGNVTATQGDAGVTARYQLTGKVTAGRDARIWAMDSISGNYGVTAGRDAYVASYAAISANVTTTGAGAYVLAGTELSGDVTGERDAWVHARTADLTGNVTSHVNDASAVAGGTVSGDVTGQRHAMAAALANVDGNVEAIDGHASAVARGGQVTGAVTAAQSAGAFALGSITGNVYAGRDAIAVTLDSSLGSVTAGRDALAVAGDAASGPVAGGRHAGVVAFGTVSSSVTAASGDAFVVTWGTVDNTVSAGDSAFVAAGDGGTVTMNAPNDVVLVSFGTVTASLTAGRDGYAWSAGNLLGNLQAARDGAAISLATSAFGLETGRDAYAWAFDEYHNNIFSGRDAMIVSLGDVNAGVFVSGSGLIYAVEDVIGSVDAGEYAGVVAWGDAAGPMTVKGPFGAFGWAYGDFNGFVESTNGNAFLTSYGNGAGAVRGGLYAEAYTVGDWVGDVEGGDDAGGVALGNFNGDVTASATGYVIAEGNVDANITAGRDAIVWAIGRVDGTYSAGRDAAAVAYGDCSLSVSADRDVVTVWSRGNLSGSITAGRNVGISLNGGAGTDAYDVFSFGTISATINALSPDTIPDGGHIGRVGAWGQIGGHFEAADTIHEVRSGDAVTATLIAPNLPTPIEFDSTIATDHPYPDTPASVVDQVLADAAAEYDLVLATKAQVAADISQLQVDFAADKATEAAALADMIAEIATSVADAITEAADALAADIALGNTHLDTEQSSAQAELTAFQNAVDAAEAAIQAQRNLVKANRNANYDQWTASATQTIADIVTEDGLIAAAVAGIPAESRADIDSRQTRWKDNEKQRLEAAARATAKEGPSFGSLYAHFFWNASLSERLDAFQFAMDVAGCIPVIGEPLDGINAVVSLLRGDLFGAGASAISIIPIAGDAIGKSMKVGRYGLKHADKLDEAYAGAKKIVRNGSDNPPAMSSATSLAKNGKKSEDVVENASNLAPKDETAELGRRLKEAGFDGGCFVPGTVVQLCRHPSLTPVGLGQHDSSFHTVGPHTIERIPTAIEEVRLGCRVPDQNPCPDDYDLQFGEVDQATWSQVGVTIRRTDGAIVEMQLLRPIEWIRNLKLEVGREFTFFMSDIEVDGRATVTSIGPCCEIADGPGNVVIGCFVTRDAADLVEVELENGTTIVGTSTHLVWHVDEDGWVDLADLREGDQLDTLSGPVKVQSIAPANELSDVYNIEVHGHHVYRITDDGILVHNNGSMHAPRRLTNADIDDYAARLRDGQLKAKDLKKAGLSPEDIADIQARSKQLRPRAHDAQKIIDDITKSENGVKEALERVRQNPGDADALKALREAEEHLNGIRAEFERLRRLEHGD